MDQKIPAFLGPRKWLDFEDDQAYEERLDELLRELHGVPPAGKPPLGANPFSGSTPPARGPSRSAGPTGRTSAGAILDEAWFAAQAEAASDGISAVGLDGAMEVRAALHESIEAPQIELLSAVRSSQIQTFGWPIAALVEGGVDEYRPRPVEDGIRAEISIGDDKFSGRTSYDYWAARTNGDFFLLQSLFEDQRSEQKIFFNTRIVRVAETLMFFRSFYDSLGVPGGALLSVALTHDGLAGRELTASTPNRQILPGARALEPKARTEHTLVLGSIDDDLAGNVQRLLAPMFMLFDFREFGEGIYADIADRFRNGEVT